MILSKVGLLMGLLMLFLIETPVLNAQDMDKTVILTSKYSGSLYHPVFACGLAVTETYNSDLTISNYYFVISAQNDRYSSLEDIFHIVSGNAQEVYNFTKWVLCFIDVCKVQDLNVPIDGFPLTIKYENMGILGKKYDISNGKEYHLFSKSEIAKIQKDLLKYCQKNAIGIDTKVPIKMNPALEKKR